MLTVACVCVPGPGNYTAKHVDRLHGMVREHLSQDFEFTVLNESPYPGWWSKALLFEPGRFEGRVLYLDLDVTVVGSLDEVADYPARFAGIRDWLNPGINSSVMVWDAGTQDHVYTQFRPEIMDRLPGDQDWISRVALPVKFPIEWFPSYKFNLNRDLNNLSPDAKAIIYHGQPKPWTRTNNSPTP